MIVTHCHSIAHIHEDFNSAKGKNKVKQRCGGWGNEGAAHTFGRREADGEDVADLVLVLREHKHKPFPKQSVTTAPSSDGKGRTRTVAVRATSVLASAAWWGLTEAAMKSQLPARQQTQRQSHVDPGLDDNGMCEFGIHDMTGWGTHLLRDGANALASAGPRHFAVLCLKADGRLWALGRLLLGNNTPTHCQPERTESFRRRGHEARTL